MHCQKWISEHNYKAVEVKDIFKNLTNDFWRIFRSDRIFEHLLFNRCNLPEPNLRKFGDSLYEWAEEYL